MPGARHAVMNGDRAEETEKVPDRNEERHVLVIANETVAGKSLIDALKRERDRARGCA